MAGPGSVVVMCHGNICRSPYAAALLQSHLERWERPRTVLSAGFIWPGRAPPPHAQAAAASNGVDLSAHRSCLISEEIVRGAELILVMEAAQRRRLQSMFDWFEGPVLLLGDFDPGPIDTRTIRDPIDQPQSVFDAVYARIEACCRELASCGAPSRLGPEQEFGDGRGSNP